MKLTGTLLRWNDDRGFGFIAPSAGGAEIFVHISAFPRDGDRPTVGEKLSYEPGRGRDGRPCAVHVARLSAAGNRRSRIPTARARKPKLPLLGTLATILLVAGTGAWGYKEFRDWKGRADLAAQPATLPGTPDEPATPSTFSCDGRAQCSQMTPCEEATWFINHCPGTEMDGNNDGTPCEQQSCNDR